MTPTHPHFSSKSIFWRLPNDGVDDEDGHDDNYNYDYGNDDDDDDDDGDFQQI